METVFIELPYGKNSILLILLILLLPSCNGHKSQTTGTQLDEFGISKEVDNTLDLVISELNEGYMSDLVIELMKSDTISSIDISLHDREYLNKYIYMYNRRLVGFTKKGKDSIIILSNIDYLYDLGSTFSKYLHPMNKKAYFNYLHIPLSLYEYSGNHTLNSDSSLCNYANWTDISYTYEPFVFSFRIREEKVCFPPVCFRR